LCEFIQSEPIRIGILAVPAPFAQEIVDRMVASGIQAILNFAPTVLKVPDSIEIRNVDLAVNLEVLTFNLGLKKQGV
jgi:redox-sensing transcriptional repressor